MIDYRSYRKELKHLCERYRFATSENEATEERPDFYTPFASCELAVAAQYRKKLRPLLEMSFRTNNYKKCSAIKKQLLFIKDVENLMVHHLRKNQKLYFESWDESLNEGVKDKIRNFFGNLRLKLRKAIMIVTMLSAIVNPSYANTERPESEKAPIVATQQNQTDNTMSKEEKRLFDLCKEFDEEAYAFRNIINYYDDIFIKNLGKLHQDAYKEYYYDYAPGTYNLFMKDLFSYDFMRNPESFSLEDQIKETKKALSDLKKIKDEMIRRGEDLKQGITKANRAL